VSILQRQGQMISTLAGNLCAVESDLKVALKTVEQQGRFMADQSVRIDQLEQLLKLQPPEATLGGPAEMAAEVSADIEARSLRLWVSSD
jgi:hypothetical protein